MESEPKPNWPRLREVLAQPTLVERVSLLLARIESEEYGSGVLSQEAHLQMQAIRIETEVLAEKARLMRERLHEQAVGRV
jgi:hypothetical protein